MEFGETIKKNTQGIKTMLKSSYEEQMLKTQDEMIDFNLIDIDDNEGEVLSYDRD